MKVTVNYVILLPHGNWLLFYKISLEDTVSANAPSENQNWLCVKEAKLIDWISFSGVVKTAVKKRKQEISGTEHVSSFTDILFLTVVTK